MSDPLERPVWSMLTGPQASLAVVTGPAVRIDPRYGPFAASDGSSEGAAALSALVAAHGEAWLVEPLEQPATTGTRVARTAPLLQMVAETPQPPQAGDCPIEPLDDRHIPAMAELALATEPGPWGPLTHRYGPFFGVLRDGKLAAMAGQRMRPAENLAEVSAVSTWPAYRGQGLAGALIRRVMAGMVARGETPFLHTYAENAGAIALYRSLGFVARRELVVTVLERA